MAEKKSLSDLLIEIPKILDDTIKSGQISVYCDSAQTDCKGCLGAGSTQCSEKACGKCESCEGCQTYCQSICQSSCQRNSQCSSCQTGCQGCQDTCQITSQAPTGSGTLSLRSKTATSVTLSLTSVSKASWYVVVYHEVGDSTPTLLKVYSTRVTIDGLEPDTSYAFSYYPENTWGTGGYSNSITVRTDPGLPGDATSIALVSKTDTTITVTVGRVTDADGYLIAYRTSGGSASYPYTTSRTYTITGLTPNTLYIINYCGQNDYGNGSFLSSSEALSVRTKISFWSWTKSNGDASASQTKAAYNAITSNGKTTDFSYLVWNDFVDKVYEAALLDSSGWRVNSDTDNMSISATRMTSGDRVMTAGRFNAVRSNIGQRVATGISHVDSGDVIKGSYFVTLADKLNDWADKT